jgi:hypothetical protein
MACHEVAEVMSRKLGGEPHPSMTQRVLCNLVYLKRLWDWRGAWRRWSLLTIANLRLVPSMPQAE